MEKRVESARIIDSYDSDIFGNERRIAVRVGKTDTDYDFIMQTSTETWAENTTLEVIVLTMQ